MQGSLGKPALGQQTKTLHVCGHFGPASQKKVGFFGGGGTSYRSFGGLHADRSTRPGTGETVTAGLTDHLEGFKPPWGVQTPSILGVCWAGPKCPAKAESQDGCYTPVRVGWCLEGRHVRSAGKVQKGDVLQPGQGNLSQMHIVGQVQPTGKPCQVLKPQLLQVGACTEVQTLRDAAEGKAMQVQKAQRRGQDEGVGADAAQPEGCKVGERQCLDMGIAGAQVQVLHSGRSGCPRSGG